MCLVLCQAAAWETGKEGRKRDLVHKDEYDTVFILKELIT